MDIGALGPGPESAESLEYHACFQLTLFKGTSKCRATKATTREYLNETAKHYTWICTGSPDIPCHLLKLVFPRNFLKPPPSLLPWHTESTARPVISMGCPNPMRPK